MQGSHVSKGEAGLMPGLFFSLVMAGPAAAATTPYFEFETLAYTEPVPIQDFRKDWRAPLSEGGDAMLHARLETGVDIGAWTVAWQQRIDYELRASDDTAALYHRARNREPFAAGERFELDLRVWHLESQGLHLAWRHELAGIGTEVALNLLEGTAVTEGALSGFAVAATANDYDYEAEVDYRYSEDALFERNVGRPYGRGYSLDVGAGASHFAQRLSWRIDVRDAAGRMRWESAPVTTAVASSSNKEYDADGYVRYNPALSGREGFQAFRQRVHPRARAEAFWQTAEHWRAGARMRVTEVHTYAGALVQRSWGDWQAEIEALPFERALGIGLAWNGIALRWEADRLDADAAHLLAAMLRVQYAFE
jgi:hypothetical protein